MKLIQKVKFLLFRESDNFLIFTLFGLVVLLVICIYTIFPNLLSNNTENDTEILIVNAQILSTIFAIIASFAILGLQFVSQDLTPRIMRNFINSKEISFFFGLYIFTIISNLFVATFPKIIDPSKFLIISYILFVFCIFSLIPSLKSIIQSIQPIRIIKNIEINIPETYYKEIISREKFPINQYDSLNDPFIDLEQIAIRSIRNNDHALFNYCIQRIAVLNIKYLEELKKIPTDNGYIEVGRDVYILQNYFLKIYDQLIFEILNQNNSCFLNELLNWLFPILENLITLKANEEIESFERKYEEIGKTLVKRKYHQYSSNYFYIITDFLELLFTYLPSGNDSLIYSDEIPDRQNRSKKEIDLWLFGEKMHNLFFRELSFFIKLVDQIGSDEEFEHAYYSFDSCINKLLIDSFKGNYNEKFRRFLIYQLLFAYIQIHEISLKNKIISVLDLGQFLLDISRHPENYDLLPFKNQFIGFFKRTGELSVEYENALSLSSIGIASRVLIKQYPSIVSELVDILINCSSKIRQKEKHSDYYIRTVRDQLTSIKHYNKNNVVEINDKIDSEIKIINEVIPN
ncbi:MAG: DUF2254 domain-containing protein [Methanoregula sp.]|nr:DUF2254 domain-containing protein [Methanoregula sp.]